MQLPKKQTHYQDALKASFERVRERDAQTLATLGAEPAGEGRFRLPVLESQLLVDVSQEAVFLPPASEDEEPKQVREEWQILVLHYLLAPAAGGEASAWVAFAEIPDARPYNSVYRGRVLGRLCGTAGRDRDTLVAASQGLGARPFELGDVGFEFQVFPNLSLRLAWFAGDDEFPPDANFLYPDNIAGYLPAEDTVVLSELVVSRLQGSSWARKEIEQPAE